MVATVRPWEKFSMEATGPWGGRVEGNALALRSRHVGTRRNARRVARLRPGPAVGRPGGALQGTRMALCGRRRCALDMEDARARRGPSFRVLARRSLEAD